MKWNICESLGTPATIEKHIPQSKICFFSLKEYLIENHAGSFLMNADPDQFMTISKNNLRIGQTISINQ